VARFKSIVLVLTSALITGCPNATLPYREEDHGSFEEEFAPHEDVHG